MLATIELFTLAIIVGGMITFQCLFAPMVFIKIEMAVARPFIRAFFPYYYLYFGALNCVLVGVTSINPDYTTVIYGICLLGFVISRQWLMYAANNATDNGQKTRFAIYHRATVLINTLQLISFIYLLWHITQ